jgi:hypothetical protein
MSPTELGPKKYFVGEAQQQLQIIHLHCRQRGRPTIINSQLSKDNFKKKEIKFGHGFLHEDRLADRSSVLR